MPHTPDEVKKGLEEELPVHYHIDGEPRLTPRQYMELQWLHKDALVLIQRLQEKNEAMHTEIVRLQAERDAAVVCIGKLTVILKKYPYAATNGCAYEAYREIQKYIDTVHGVQKEE